MKARKGYFRAWDHQLMQEAYPFTVKPKGEMKDKWDMLALGAAVPGANEPLEVISPTKTQNPCEMKAWRRCAAGAPRWHDRLQPLRRWRLCRTDPRRSEREHHASCSCWNRW